MFTQIYRCIALLAEAGDVGSARTEAASQLFGRLLIVGLGPGYDLHHLPPMVSSVVAIEPSRPLGVWACAAARLNAATRPNATNADTERNMEPPPTRPDMAEGRL